MDILQLKSCTKEFSGEYHSFLPPLNSKGQRLPLCPEIATTAKKQNKTQRERERERSIRKSLLAMIQPGNLPAIPDFPDCRTSTRGSKKKGDRRSSYIRHKMTTQKTGMVWIFSQTIDIGEFFHPDAECIYCGGDIVVFNEVLQSSQNPLLDVVKFFSNDCLNAEATF